MLRDLLHSLLCIGLVNAFYLKETSLGNRTCYSRRGADQQTEQCRQGKDVLEKHGELFNELIRYWVGDRRDMIEVRIIVRIGIDFDMKISAWVQSAFYIYLEREL